MYVGMLTICYGARPLEEVIDFAAANGIQALEIAAMPGNEAFDPTTASDGRAREIAQRCGDQGLVISALANFADPTVSDKTQRQAAVDALKRTVDLCGIMGTNTITANAGIPEDGMTREEALRTVLPEVWPALGEYAQAAGVRFAFENYWGTVLMNLSHFRLLVEQLECPALGFNMDPSHLAWQQIDYLSAVYEFGERIYHAHAKDVEVREHDLRYYGCHSHIEGNHGDFWRYVMPGMGIIDWGRFAGALRSIGYNGALSLEHEDDMFELDAGFIQAARHLQQYVEGR